MVVNGYGDSKKLKYLIILLIFLECFIKRIIKCMWNMDKVM